MINYRLLATGSFENKKIQHEKNTSVLYEVEQELLK